ncbi:fatty acid synthase-like [Diabrotica undecimpunctata]|uniref:fatty acid synthase-like n=1 Tax=Diabrotica undecimpunctata TaxID=50387 RepID=UPI003B633611
MNIVPDDVVISGIGGLFPKSTNIGEFKQRLFENEILLEQRFEEGTFNNASGLVGCINSEQFDHSFFGIHRQQSLYADPMHRLALERALEALADAGIRPSEFRGRRIGCFMGSTVGEDDHLFMESVVSGFGITGHSRAMLANRISYFLNLRGPSVAYDCNWISGMEVLRLAYCAIKSGQCEAVIVGTTNLASLREFHELYEELGFLSKDGSTKAFDADASGYARSEGVVLMVVQKSSECRKHYASIEHIATRFDGTTADRFMSIDENNMVEFLEDFYEKCRIKPNDIEYLETYGCGLKEIDKRELNGLARVFCKDRPKPLSIGSVKTITGHAEASSSLFSIVNALVALDSDCIPATLQYSKPNPDIKALVDGKFKVLTENKKWKPTYVAVNALGISSYFGHAVFKANPKEKVLKKIAFPVLLNASTRTEEGIDKIIETLKKKQKDPEFYNLVHQFFAKAIQGHLYRGYLLLEGEETKFETVNYMGNKRQVWFVYSGMGSQWNQMLGDLMQIPIFAKSIQKSCEILAKKGVDLMNILSSSEKTIFDNILHCFVGIASMQIALTDVLKALGIEPDGIIGHSVGELGCAYADGCMTHEQMILSSYSRGRASIEATLIPGMMAAIGLGYNQIKDQLPPTIEVACHNGPDSCTISGPEKDMEEYVKTLSAKGTFAKLVNVANIAYHSRYIQPAGPLLRKYLKEVLPTPMPRSSKWISTSNLEGDWDTDLAKHSSADYHTNNLLSSVLFEEGIKHIPKDSVLIEIAPHGLLQAILKRSVPQSVNVPLTKRGSKSGTEFLLQALGKIYLAGVDMNLANIYPKIEYPVSRNTETLADLIHWNRSDNWSRDSLQKSKSGVRNFNLTLTAPEFSECMGHKLNGRYVLPISTLLNIIVQISGDIKGAAGLRFENLHFRKPLVLSAMGSIPINAMIQQGSGEFEIFCSESVLVLSGKITIIENEEEIGMEKTEIKLDQDNLKLQSEDIYSEFEHRGYEYSSIYKTIKDLTLTEEGSVSTVEWKDHWLFLLEAIVQQQIFNAGERSQDMHVPKFIQKITIVNNDLPQDQKDVSIHYDYSSRLIYTSGMEVSDMETVPFECKSEGVKISKIDIVQLDNGVLNNMKAGIELAFHLCLSNHGQQSDKKMYVSEYVVNNSLSEHIKPVIRDFHKCNINYLAVKEIRQLNTIDTFAKLIIINDVVSKEIIKVIKNCDTAFLLAKVDRTQQLDPAIARVAYFRVGQDHYMICKKVTDVKPKIINIKEPTISLSDLQKKSIVWVAELLKFSNESSKQQIPILLTTSAVPSEGFIDFIEGIRSLPNMEHVRIFYNLDKTPNRVNEVIKRDISLVILNNNQWWTYMPLNVDNQNEKLIDRQSDAPILENKSISYLGVNLKDETLTPNNNDKNEIGNIDYAGLAKNGERVMGLAYLDKENSKLIVDDDFTWKIPAGWTFESAATAPHAYTSAYYMLVIKARVKHGDTVLIHSGCSPVGFAAMNIAFSYGCQVFVTVNSERQKAFIKKHFTYMQARNILNYTNTKFETDLMTITGGKGAEVILNCLSGLLLRSSLNCIANYGRFIQYGKYDMEEGGSIGMYCFLRNVSFYCVDLNKIFFKEKDIKAELNKLIEEGLANYTVRPLKREVIKKDEVADVMSILQNRETIGKIVVETGNTMNINKINFKDPNRFICNAKDSYLIWGGSANHWSHIAEWLVHRGARKIVIASESKPKENHLNRRLQFLQTYYGADLIMAPSRVQTKEHAQNLVSDVQNFGKLHAVFTLSQSMTVSATESESVELLEKALERIAPKAILINFVKSAVGLCYIRAPDYPTYNINVNTEEGVKDAIVFLDKVLCYKISNLSLRRDTQLEETQGSVKSVIKDVTQLLPSEQEVIRLQKNASDEPEFVQVLTEGPLEIRELAPLFVIPGLTGFAELEQMLKHILYPTFCAVLPSKSWSLDKLAKVCAQRMSEIYSGNDYNIVSISTGGALAIEIAKILSKQNKNLHLFFVDSAPMRIQQGLEDIGEGQQLEINLLRIIFDISDPEIIKKLTNSSNLESRVQMLLKDRTDLNDKNKKLLEQGLPAIKDYIEKVKAYKPDNEPINAKLHILLPEDCSAYESFGLSSYFTSLPEFAQFDGDHLSIIASYDVCEYINKHHYQD